MSARALYSFKLGNEYMNNILYDGGAYDDSALAISKSLFEQNFANMNEVVEYLVNEDLILQKHYLYYQIKNYSNDHLYDFFDGMKEDEIELFCEKIKNNKNFFDNQLLDFDFGNYDTSAHYFIDLDKKKL